MKKYYIILLLLSIAILMSVIGVTMAPIGPMYKKAILLVLTMFAFIVHGMACGVKKALIAIAIAILSAIGVFLYHGHTTTQGVIEDPIRNTSAQVQTVINKKYDLTVDFIDVGQGDSALLRSGNETMLIDTGTPESGTAIRLFLKKQGVSVLDYLVLTHPDADHILRSYKKKNG